MNSFSFFLSRKLFICPLILNDSFARQSSLGYRSLFFMTLNVSCQSLLACNVSFEKSADSLIGIPLQVTDCFSLAAFKILSLSLTLGILFMMCLGVSLFGSTLFGTLCFLYLHFFHQITEVFFHYFFQIDFQILSPLFLAPL